MQQNRLAEAQKVLDDELKTVADDPDLLYYVAGRYTDIGQKDKTEQILQDVLYRNHPSVHIFKHAYEKLKHVPENHSFKIGLRFDKDCDRRRYNLPTAGSTEVAVIIPGDGDQELQPRDIVLYVRGGGLKQINEMNDVVVKRPRPGEKGFDYCLTPAGEALRTVSTRSAAGAFSMAASASRPATATARF